MYSRFLMQKSRMLLTSVTSSIWWCSWSIVGLNRSFISIILGKSELWPSCFFFKEKLFIAPEAGLHPHTSWPISTLSSPPLTSRPANFTSSPLCSFSLRLQVGFFPCDCVELINDKIPPSVQSSVPKPGACYHSVARGFLSFRVTEWPNECVPSSSVCKKHGKLVTFLRTFMKSRPPPQKLRQRGILKERVFGCDLGEHLHSSEHEGELDLLCFSLIWFPIKQHCFFFPLETSVPFPVLKLLPWMFYTSFVWYWFIFLCLLVF